MGAERKSIGELIDALITADIRCWMAQDDIMDAKLSDSKRLDAAITAQKSNARRTGLMRAIDELLGDAELAGFTKSYIKEG